VVLFFADPSLFRPYKAGFWCTNGSHPYGGHTRQRWKSFIYGMTSAGGSNGQRVLFFALIPSVRRKKLKDFDSGHQWWRLLATNTCEPRVKLYGTTNEGGIDDGDNYFIFPWSFLFQLTKSWRFDYTNDTNPSGSFIQAAMKLYKHDAVWNNGCWCYFFTDPSSSTYIKPRTLVVSSMVTVSWRPYRDKRWKTYGMTRLRGGGLRKLLWGLLRLWCYFSFDLPSSTHSAKIIFWCQ